MTHDMKHNDMKRNKEQRISRMARILFLHHTSCGRLLRTLLLLMVMMTLGVGEMRGQLNGAGTYFIKNNSTEYYLVPTINCFYNENENQPHLTTFKTGGDKNSIWRVEVESDGNKTYYRLIHNATGKYIIINNPVTDLANGNAHRKRIHLETTNTLGDNSLFEIGTTDNTNYYILPGKSEWYSTDKKNSTDGTFKYFNPRGGNKDRYRADDGSAINNTTNTNGIIGFWSSTGGDSNWNFVSTTNTCANPVIEYTDASTIQISYPISSDTGWTIYYTTDGSDPSNNTNARTSIISTASIPATGVSKVRAIATNEGWDPSDEAVLIASGANQLIQSKDCEAFYMVPPVNDDDDTHATTTNIPTTKMGWVFEPDGLYCGIQYYKIMNSVTNEYLYCNVGGKAADALVMKASSAITTVEDEYRAKFRLIPQADGSYKLIAKWWAAENPPGGYYLTKNNDNVERIKTAVDTDNKSQWNVIAVPTSPKAQFDASFASSSTDFKFYLIQSATDNTYQVLPPATAGGNATANTTGANPEWFFYPVDDNDTWIPYYYIRNSNTGEYLFFNGAAGANNTFFTSASVEAGNEDRYKFIVVKSANVTYPGNYNIIPKALKDQANQANNSLNRTSTTLRTQNSRATNASVWKLTPTSLFCNDPVFTETEGSISISCIPDITKIYYTTDGSTPTENPSMLYDPANTTWSASSKVRVKAVAVVPSSTTSASSNVITLLNNPDVTLAGAPYTYKGTAWQPAVTVSIGEGATVTTAASGTYTPAYSNNTNAGTATVTVADADATDSWYIWNVADQTFNIIKAPLTVTANDNTIGYGDEPDNAGVAYSGFVNSETDAVLGGTLSYRYNTAQDGSGTAYTSYVSSQGTYYIIPYGLTSTNYAFTYIPGTLTVEQKSIGDGTIASGFTLSFDEDNSIVLKQGEITLAENTDYTVVTSSATSKYSTRTVSGTGNYTGNFSIRNAIAHFTTDANRTEWSVTFVAESAGVGDIGHALPDGIKAYIITGIEGDWAIPEQLEYIPAGVPVLLLANEEKNGFLVEDANSGDVTVVTQTQKDNNMLEEVTNDPSKHFNTKEIYLLYNNEFVFNKAGDLAKGKVYLNPNHTPAPSRLRIAWNHSTGIDDTRPSPLTPRPSSAWYTLDGRRLNGKPVKKGLYLCNGEKIAVK